MRVYRSVGQSRSVDAKPFSDVSPNPGRSQRRSQTPPSDDQAPKSCTPVSSGFPISANKRTSSKGRAPVSIVSQSPQLNERAPRVTPCPGRLPVLAHDPPESGSESSVLAIDSQEPKSGGLSLTSTLLGSVLGLD